MIYSISPASRYNYIIAISHHPVRCITSQYYQAFSIISYICVCMTSCFLALETCSLWLEDDRSTVLWGRREITQRFHSDCCTRTTNLVVIQYSRQYTVVTLAQHDTTPSFSQSVVVTLTVMSHLQQSFTHSDNVSSSLIMMLLPWIIRFNKYSVTRNLLYYNVQVSTVLFPLKTLSKLQHCKVHLCNNLFCF